MKRIIFFFLPILLLLFLLSGCLPPLQNNAIIKVKNTAPPPGKPSVAAKTTENAVATHHPAQVDISTLDNNNESSRVENAGKDEAPTKDDNSIEEIPAFTESVSTIEEKPLTIKQINAVLDEALDYCQVSQDLWQKGELENALEALDQAYALILKVNTYDNFKLIQQKEDLRFLISKRILEIYASRNIVVSGNHKAIPMVRNKYTQAEINHFTGDEKKFFLESYRRSGRFRPHIVPALEEAGLPVELSWLPLIESGFKVNALSSARALGLWQFIPSTGYKFGLKRDRYIDERLDPIKATKAATEYLKELHQIFGDWSTVLAAYNCGEGRVLRLIRNQNINYLDNFWDLYEQLPRETARYVPRFLAALQIINNPEQYGLDSIELDKPLEFETVTVSKRMHLRDIAKKIGVPEKSLRELNPELRYRILPDEKYPLRVPTHKGNLLISKLDEIPVTYLPQRAYIKHKVRSGESLSTIARRYRTSVSRIARANKIRKRNYIVAGTVLKIPGKRTVIPRSTGYKRPPGNKAFKYNVKRGDSLWILAKRYGTTTKNIIALNNLPNTKLHIRQVLKIPGRNYERSEKNGFKTYSVKRGDSPFVIAKRHNMSLERFLRINNLTPRSKIYPRQNLYVD